MLLFLPWNKQQKKSILKSSAQANIFRLIESQFDHELNLNIHNKFIVLI